MYGIMELIPVLEPNDSCVCFFLLEFCYRMLDEMFGQSAFSARRSWFIILILWCLFSPNKFYVCFVAFPILNGNSIPTWVDLTRRKLLWRYDGGSVICKCENQFYYSIKHANYLIELIKTICNILVEFIFIMLIHLSLTELTIEWTYNRTEWPDVCRNDVNSIAK